MVKRKSMGGNWNKSWGRHRRCQMTRCMVIAMYAKYERRRRSVVVASSLDHNRPSPRLDTFFVLVTKLRSIALRFSLAWCFA